jgi:hypothetical protein
MSSDATIDFSMPLDNSMCRNESTVASKFRKYYLSRLFHQLHSPDRMCLWLFGMLKGIKKDPGICCHSFSYIPKEWLEHLVINPLSESRGSRIGPTKLRAWDNVEHQSQFALTSDIVGSCSGFVQTDTMQYGILIHNAQWVIGTMVGRGEEGHSKRGTIEWPSYCLVLICERRQKTSSVLILNN